MKTIAIKSLLCGGLLALTGCAGMPDMKGVPIGSTIANLVPGGSRFASAADSAISVAKDVSDSQKEMSDPDEIELGENVMAGVLGAAPLYGNDRIQRYVNQVGRWVASHSERPNLPWRFAVLDSKLPNAGAAPGGQIYITTGLLFRMRNEAELAGALAHEIAHVVHRHHLQAMRTALRLGAPAGLPALVRQVHTQGVGAEAEHAADREAVTLTARAGLDPYGLVSALVQVNALGDSDLQFADAHPQSRLRLDHLEQAMARRFDPLVGTKAPVTVDARLEMAGIK